MDPKEVFSAMQKGNCILVDVREEDELRSEGIAEGALWMPTSKMDTDEWTSFKQKLPKGKDIVCYCKSGMRSGRVAGLLCAEGFQAKNLGGFSVWKNAQLPTKKFA